MSAEKVFVETEVELKALRDKLDKIKVIVLNDFGKHPLTNILELPYRERNIIKARITELFNIIEDYELTEKFNKICAETLFTENAKIENYSVYNRYNEPAEDLKLNNNPNVLYDPSGNLIIM